MGIFGTLASTLIVFLFFGIPLSHFIHELGHAVAARIVGFRIHEFQIGSMRNIFARNLFGVFVKIGIFPFPCRVVVEGTQETKKWQWIVAILAGPMFEILFGGVLFAWALSNYSESILFKVTFGSVGFYNMFAGVGNLIPFGNTDGSQIKQFLNQ